MVTAATIRQNVFSTLRTLISDNLPTYNDKDENLQTYSIVAKYSEKDAPFPCIVLNKALIIVPPLTMDAQTVDYEIEVQLQFCAKSSHGKEAIDAGQDSLLNTFIGNIPTFISTDKLIPMEDFWTDNDSSIFEDNNQIVNTATSIVRFKLA